MRAAAATLALAAIAAAAACGRTPPVEPDLIIHNARVHTISDARPAATALAVTAGRIQSVGEDAEVMALAGDRTDVLDLAGRTVLPGLIDAHAHVSSLGASLQRLDFRGITTFQEVAGMVARRAATAPPGEWILGRGWDQNLWPDRRFPSHGPLDKAAPRHPVFLTRVDGHAGVANAVAMEAAGITSGTADPDGGRMLRDERGEPTGVFIDAAQRLISSRIPPESERQIVDSVRRADAEMSRVGLTMVHDAGVDVRTLSIYRRLAAERALSTRLYVMLRGSAADLQPFFAQGPVVDDRVSVRAIKIVADGALGSRGAALLEDYSDDPGNRGLLVTPLDEIEAQTLAAARAGFQTAVHAIGDRANRHVLDIFARVQRQVASAKATRMRVEHAQILDPADVARFAALGVIASMQPAHCTSDMPWVPSRIGPARTASGAYLWRTLLASGARIAGGSDFPVEPPNPMLGMYAAITRQDLSGQPADGWAPDQRATRLEALKWFTIDAAYAAHMDDRVGSLEPGKLADLIVLSGDPLTVPAASIPALRVLKTMIGGRWVYDSERRP